ncbi:MULTISPECIES: hypothetical protein [unclassified Rhizobium]|uniref:hypothetical protein n=1 Tax=unclassified Rhizobium TaxID=2613769 RepID=UPI001609247D|nr:MULTISPECIES: hypothetical protein [unclassified Rhizobium]MBB3297919.1 hypothetical protein [Rhizobium sp. BK112]MBB4177586.1 hypothetical protein [Rhizobium sp. BK109]
MTDDEKLTVIAEGLGKMPLRLISAASSKAIVTEMLTSIPLEPSVIIDGSLYETELLWSDGTDFRYKLRPAHASAFD